MQRLDYRAILPAGAQSLAGVYAYVSQCGLSSSLVELVYLRVSQINNCAYCLDMHTRALLDQGEKTERLALVQVWAETVTQVAQTNIPDRAFDAVRSVFDEKELVDLTIAISLMNAYNRIAISFRNLPKACASNEKRVESPR